MTQRLSVFFLAITRRRSRAAAGAMTLDAEGEDKHYLGGDWMEAAAG